MTHAMIKKSSPEQVKIARNEADWLIDAVAGATQDRRFLRGDDAYDDVMSEAIIGNGVVACLRAMHAEADTLRAEVARLKEAADDMAELLAQTVTMHASGFWLRDRDAALASYRAALAHGESGN
tara:strand:- start:2507 stop:2878 length:372 start_codon:yes stop_codon:yes gene_type:complete